MLYVYCLLCEMVCESFEVYGLVTHDLATVRLVLAISSSYNIISHVPWSAEVTVSIVCIGELD